MDLTLRIISVVISLLGVAAAIYNIITSRTHAQQQQTKNKVDQAMELGQRNEAAIEKNATAIDHLKEQMELRDRNTKERLDQIGTDVAYVKDLFVKFLLIPRNP